jgi:hypothetical protein
MRPPLLARPHIPLNHDSYPLQTTGGANKSPLCSALSTIETFTAIRPDRQSQESLGSLRAELQLIS